MRSNLNFLSNKMQHTVEQVGDFFLHAFHVNVATIILETTDIPVRSSHTLTTYLINTDNEFVNTYFGLDELYMTEVDINKLNIEKSKGRWGVSLRYDGIYIYKTRISSIADFSLELYNESTKFMEHPLIMDKTYTITEQNHTVTYTTNDKYDELKATLYDGKNNVIARYSSVYLIDHEVDNKINEIFQGCLDRIGKITLESTTSTGLFPISLSRQNIKQRITIEGKKYEGVHDNIIDAYYKYMCNGEVYVTKLAFISDTKRSS